MAALCSGVVLASTFAMGAPTTAMAQPQPGRIPPNDTDHGVAPTTFHTLWAGDEDQYRQVSVPNSSEPGAGVAALANGTDIPLDEPPAAVERWNRGDLRDRPHTGHDAAAHPPNATLDSGGYITDAGVTIFAVQPSTRALTNPGDQPRYVGSSGDVLAHADYRVDVPDSVGKPGDRVVWTLETTDVNQTWLEVDGNREGTGGGTLTPTIDFSNLDAHAGQAHTLTVHVEIYAELEQMSERCDRWSFNGHCLDVNRTYEEHTETLIVSDSITVTEYDLSVSGFYARYPDGDLGLVVYKNQPWLGYSVPNGSVRGVWRFYVARDEQWDRLTVYTEGDTSQIRSPMQPLQVHAYPYEPGPTPSPRGHVQILNAYGVQTRPPTLPPDVHLDVVAGPYTASYGIASRTNTSAGRVSDIVAQGLVRGVTARANESGFATVHVNRSNLTLEVLSSTDRTITVRATLVDADTNVSINTAGREGYIVLAGERVNTTGNGTVTRTIPKPARAVTARYQPGRWWRNSPGYTADTAIVTVPSASLSALATLYRLAIPVSLFLLGVFLIDRITGWGIWPPWRGL